MSSWNARRTETLFDAAISVRSIPGLSWIKVNTLPRLVCRTPSKFVVFLYIRNSIALYFI